MLKRTGAFTVVLFGLVGVWLAAAGKPSLKALTEEQRKEILRHAQVWAPTDIPSLDIKAGPKDEKAFAPDDTVTCEFDTKKSVGNTPKFWCAVEPGDVVKVKYGEKNGEVYGEVAASRLLWAVGFGADRQYPVKVQCAGCSANPFEQQKKESGEHLFDPATIERPMQGHEIESKSKPGWSWVELSNVDQTIGGAPLAQRDALRLLAVFMQHTDSKPIQQKLICLDPKVSDDGLCEKPFMMLHDVGKTFGKANTFNHDIPGSVDLKAWSSMHIWKDKKGCVANMPKSMTGSLEDPVISEQGRKFLAGLLTQLSDQQIHDLFDVARVTRRDTGTTVDDWVAAFKAKRDEIVTQTCTS